MAGGNEMTPEEIVRELIDYLDLRLSHGAIEQEVYKRDLFKIFAEAYRNGYVKSPSHPLLTAGSLEGIISARWFPDTDKATLAEKKKLLGSVTTKWREWHFALDHYNRV